MMVSRSVLLLAVLVAVCVARNAHLKGKPWQKQNVKPEVQPDEQPVKKGE